MSFTNITAQYNHAGGTVWCQCLRLFKLLRLPVQRCQWEVVDHNCTRMLWVEAMIQVALCPVLSSESSRCGIPTSS